MSNGHGITARIDDTLIADLDRLAGEQDQSRSGIVAAAIERYVREEIAFLDYLQEGIDDLEQGRWISHEDLVREIRERRSAKRAA